MGGGEESRARETGQPRGLGRRAWLSLAGTGLAIVIALGGGKLGFEGPGRADTAEGAEGRVAILAVEGLGPADIEALGLAGRVGRVHEEPPLAYGIVRRAPPPASEAVWFETMTGLFAGQRRTGQELGGKTVWERTEVGGKHAAVFPSQIREIPGARGGARADGERMAEALVAWRETRYDLVVAGVGCVATEKLSEGRGALSAECGAVLDSLVRDWVLAPGEGGTVLVVSSASAMQGPEPGGTPAAPGEGPVYLGPGLVLASGRGVGGRRWPAIARLADVAPTVFHMLGEALPGDMNGIVLSDLLDPAFLFHEPIRYAPRSAR